MSSKFILTHGGFLSRVKNQGFPASFESGPQSSVSLICSRSFLNSLLESPKILCRSTYAFASPRRQTPSPLLATSSNCTLSAPVLASGSAPRVSALSALRPLKLGIPLKTVLVGLASLQPCFGGIYSARLQARLETKSRATKGARLRLKTYVRCHFLVRT